MKMITVVPTGDLHPTVSSFENSENVMVLWSAISHVHHVVVDRAASALVDSVNNVIALEVRTRQQMQDSKTLPNAIVVNVLVQQNTL
jgi:hypothetical protein